MTKRRVLAAAKREQWTRAEVSEVVERIDTSRFSARGMARPLFKHYPILARFHEWLQVPAFAELSFVEYLERLGLLID